MLGVEARQRRPQTGAAGAGAMSQAMTLLLVDGHAGVRTALAARLRQERAVARVDVAATLEDGLRLAQEWPPDLILYDPRTVPGAAISAVRQLAEEGRCVVILTSSLRDNEAQTLPRAGARALLFKGLAIAPLLACLEEVRAGRPPLAPQGP
jgi:NarL family two-component system response regulator LiaR